MDMNINTNYNLGGITPGKIEQKPPLKKQEEIVTDWQLPQDELTVNLPVADKKTEKPEKKAEKKPAEVKTEVKHEKMMIIDGMGNLIIGSNNKDTSVPGTLFIDEPINLPHPGGDEFVVPWQLPAPDGMKEIGPVNLRGLSAGPDTTFFSTGLNSIDSIAKDGLFLLDGTKIA